MQLGQSLIHRRVSVATLLQAGLVAAMLLAASIGQWCLQSHAATTAPLAVSDTEVAEAVIAHIRQVALDEKLLNPATDDLTVDIQHIPQEPRQFYGEPAGPVSISTDSNLDKQFRHQAYIRLTLTHPNGESHTLGVPVRITISKPVWVAKGQIRPGTVLDGKVLSVEKRPLTHELAEAIPAGKPLGNQVARILVLEGDILKVSQTTIPLAVRSQGFVKIQLTAPQGVRMMVEGKALEDGHIGDLIRVRNKINPERLYTAKVVGPNRVAVTL